MYLKIRGKFVQIIKEYGLQEEEVTVKAKPLTSEEAIGNPEEDDYPLIKGKERLMQAEFKNSFGQAFTDMYGNYKGKLTDIMRMELKNNFRRAIFISTLNAVMGYLKLADKTVHCKNKEPRECSKKLAGYIREKFGSPDKIAIVGFQPRMVEALAKNFKVRVTDLDSDNIGKEKFGVYIEDANKTEENLKWCDVALITGTTVVNNSIKNFLISKPVIFYGVTIAGAAELLDLNRFCPLAT
ncbi:MAG: DUF364 domain-containing protein [Candidatus Aerophobetes bacterium]|nr:DUF364 domain-containing protein [Candidatus Aerophobetes bacterium]